MHSTGAGKGRILRTTALAVQDAEATKPEAVFGICRLFSPVLSGHVVSEAFFAVGRDAPRIAGAGTRRRIVLAAARATVDFWHECGIVHAILTGLSGYVPHMPLIPDPNRPVRTSAGGGGIGNRCLARYWGQPCVPSPSPSYSSMSLRRMSSDKASGFSFPFIAMILRTPVMALVIFWSVACISCCCASIFW